VFTVVSVTLCRLMVLWTPNNCELRKRHSKRGKIWKGQEGSTTAKSLSMYSITENIYYSQLSSVAILLQPEPNCFTSYNTRKGLCFLSLYVLSSCGLPLPPTCLLVTVNEARSYTVQTSVCPQRTRACSRHKLVSVKALTGSLVSYRVYGTVL
jgi:hypothetical protein